MNAALSAPVAQPLRVRLADERDGAVALAHFRLMVMMILAMGITLAIVAKLAWMAISASPDTRSGLTAGLVAARADIVDRNGVPLARTIMGWSIGVRPAELLNDRASLAVKLAAMLPEHDAAWYLQRLRSPRRFEYLKRRALPAEVERIGQLGEPGIQLGREPERLYPQGTMAAQVIGFADDDGVGQIGMERALNTRLADPAQRNSPVALSIDARVQAAVETELLAALTNQNAEAASALVLDVHTGEVVAMASLPTYNPNAPSDMPPSGVDEDGRPLLPPTFNRVTGSVYELGSTFKPITAANAIESGTVTDLGKRYDARFPLQVGKFKISDDHPQRRWLDVPETLIYSSNIATARIADELGPKRMQAMFRKLGFDKRAPIELGGVGHPLFPSFWAKTTTMTTGYGHGIAVSPLHLANAYAALVNGGILRPATMLKRAPGAVPAGTRVFQASTSDTMRKLLRLIVTQGTGERANAPGYRIGGKTGTAEKPKATGGYYKHANVSTFASAFPMDEPRFVVVAMLDDPKGSKESSGLVTAGMVSAPIVGRIVQRIGPLLGIYPDERRDVDESQMMQYVWAPKSDQKVAAARAKWDRQ